MPRSPGRIDLAFCAALALLLSALWQIAIRVEGSAAQAAFWDTAWFHVRALRIHRELETGGLAELAHTWTRTSGTHTPLVPTASALLMSVFGESRFVAELVLPLSTLLLLVSVFGCVERLYGRASAHATTALVAAFPVFLTYTRAYYFEATAAATFAASCWALIASDRFARWKPAIAFGALAGLAALSRAAAGVYVVGPALVAATLALREPDRWRRMARLAVATGIALLLSATWYLPNLGRLARYLTSSTYGRNAEVFAGGSSAFSISSLVYYAQWCVLDGPGVAMAALGGLAVAIAARERGARSLATPTAAALAAVFAIDFALLLVGAQRMGGKFLLPLMPIVALAIVRAVAAVPSRGARRALGAAVAALAIHHVVACTFVAPRPADAPSPAALPFPSAADASGPRLLLGSLWNHSNLFVEWSRAGGGRPEADYRIPEVVDRLASLGLPSGARVVVFGPTAFFEAATLNLEALRRSLDWIFEDRPSFAASSAEWEQHVLAALDADAVVLRGEGRHTDLFEQRLRERAFPFEEEGAPIALGDGTRARFFKRAR